MTDPSLLHDPSIPTCPGCNHETCIRIGAIPEGYHFAGRTLDTRIPGGSLFRCQACDLAFKWPQLSKEELNRLYQLAESEVWTYDPAQRADWVIAKQVLLSLKKSGNLLDVGCFDGGFLRFVAESDKKWRLFGVELNTEAAIRAEQYGIEILGSDADKVDDLGTFDAVVSFDVVEHLNNPAAFLESLSRLVNPGGIIMMSTGNIDSWSWRTMGSRYWYCTLAEHLSFPSPKWCAKMAPSLGLSLESVHLFSHVENRSLKLQVSETLKNLTYRLFPVVFRQLRKFGMGGVDLDFNPDLADTPPIWISAKDQYLVVFKKS